MNLHSEKARRNLVLGAVAVLMALPPLYAVASKLSFDLRNRNNGSIVTSGRERKYILFVPTTYDPRRPAPLVLSFHGAGGWPALQRDISTWNALAEREGFLVAYPAGRDAQGPRIWRVNRGPGLGEDVRFVSDLIDDLRRRYNIDPARIYANGLSNGGGMSFALSCTLSHRIAAVGLVGAALTLPFSWCTDPAAVPMIAFHGTADTMAPYRGGDSTVSDRAFPNIERWAMHWARRNRCDPQPLQSRVAPDVTRRSYTGCADGADVVLYSIHGGGHTWPGGQQLPEWFAGRTATSIDATREMWAFFAAHPLRRGGT